MVEVGVLIKRAYLLLTEMKIILGMEVGLQGGRLMWLLPKTTGFIFFIFESVEIFISDIHLTFQAV